MPATFRGALPEDDPIFSGGPMFVFKRPLVSGAESEDVTPGQDEHGQESDSVDELDHDARRKT
jgi:hypothetical protein